MQQVINLTTNDLLLSSYADLPREIVLKSFKQTDNVSAIKGFAIDRLKRRLSPSASVDSALVIVTCENKRLKDGHKLVDIVCPSFRVLTVQYPEDGITLQSRNSSPVSDEFSLSMFHF